MRAFWLHFVTIYGPMAMAVCVPIPTSQPSDHKLVTEFYKSIIKRFLLLLDTITVEAKIVEIRNFSSTTRATLADKDLPQYGKQRDKGTRL